MFWSVFSKNTKFIVSKSYFAKHKITQKHIFLTFDLNFKVKNVRCKVKNAHFEVKNIHFEVKNICFKAKNLRFVSFVSFVFCKTKYENYRVKIELLFFRNKRSDSNYNQIFEYEFGKQGLIFWQTETEEKASHIIWVKLTMLVV